jgi:H+/Cl- antiporter ClcA
MLLRSGWTYIFLGIVFFIALGLSPSRQDLKALPAFLITAFVVGLVGYFVMWMVSKKVNLSSTAVAVERALRTANTGLVFVLIAVAVTVGVLLVVERVVLRG